MSGEERRDKVAKDIARFLFYTDTKGKNWEAISRAVTGASLERTIEGASTLTYTLRDPDRLLMQSPALLTDEDGRLKVIDNRIDFGVITLDFRLVKVSKTGEDVQIVLEDRAVAALREARTPRKARRDQNMNRAQFVRSLVQSIKAPVIPFYAPELAEGPQPVADRPRSEQEQVDQAQKNPGLDRTVRITVKGVRATSGQLHAIELAMSEADRLNVEHRVRKAMLLAGISEGQFVADRLNFSGSGALGPWQGLRSTMRALGIPYDGSDTAVTKGARAFMVGINGSGFRGPGYDATSLMKANPSWSASHIAEEVEGAGVGNFYSTWESEADAIISAWGGGPGSERGGTVTVEKDYFFSVGRPHGPKGENYWEATGRMAEEVGRRRFVTKGEFWWISEQDLFARKVGLVLSEDSKGVLSIDFDLDNGKKVKECTVECRADDWAGSPGGLVRIADLGPATGKWLVSTVTQDLFTDDTTVVLRKPIREKPEPTAELVTRSVAENAGADGAGGVEGSGALFEECKKISDAGGPYVYGGGHGPALSSLSSGQGLDCSSSVSLALYRAGLFDSTVAWVSGTFAASYGQPGKGEEFTVWAHSGHVYIEFHGANAGWRFDTSPQAGDSTSASGPRLRKGSRSSAGFTPRHKYGH